MKTEKKKTVSKYWRIMVSTLSVSVCTMTREIRTILLPTVCPQVFQGRKMFCGRQKEPNKPVCRYSWLSIIVITGQMEKTRTNLMNGKGSTLMDWKKHSTILPLISWIRWKHRGRLPNLSRWVMKYKPACYIRMEVVTILRSFPNYSIQVMMRWKLYHRIQRSLFTRQVPEIKTCITGIMVNWKKEIRNMI